MAIERAIMYGKIAGLVETRNMFHAEITPIAGDDIHDLWYAYLEPIYSHLQNLTAPAWTTYQYELQTRIGDEYVTYYTGAFSLSGTAQGDLIPNIVSMVLLGVAPGIRKVGRKFFSGLAESAVNGNSLAVSAATDAAAMLLAYITPATSILGSQLVPGIVNSVGTFSAFTSGAVSSLLGSMKRRKPGRGI